VSDILLSVVIPAFNEELYLPETLSRLRDAISLCTCGVEIIVVDNQSIDGTVDVARSFGAAVIQEAVHNIARVRNAGATFAKGEVLVLVDADTTVPREFLQTIAEAMKDSACMGGSADIVHSPTSKLLRAYLKGWRWLGTRLGMVQGAAQFCRKSAFIRLKGYDESLFMGEDVDFYWRLQKLCASDGGHLRFLDELKVVPSPRRFEQTPIWRTLIWTNPLFITLFRKTSSAWTAWYVRTPR
jgi:glycosyltransferase involved in cell wall biosynthesis